MAFVNIQGIDVKYRDLRPDEQVLNEGVSIEDQYFEREPHPFTDDEIVAIASKEHTFSSFQAAWVELEKKRMTYGEGVYIWIRGRLTYIPASYWGYLNHWTLEGGEKPDYREADRVFFLLMEFLYFETDVLALTWGKCRRRGATSIGFYFTWWICGRLPEKVGGSISFNDDAAQNNFQKMFMRGFRAMLPCFVEEFDSDSENFVRFVKHVEKKKKGVPIKREGLNSYVNYLATTINSYDSGRLSFGLFDEGGKYAKMNVNTYWSKVSPTLKKGKYKVGMAYMPTTVNPENQGGANYEVFWKTSNQNAINPETGEPYGLNTPNKVVRYFVSAAEGYAGCIDKYGDSVIDDPKEPIMGNDGLMITEGARTVILRDRATKTGEQLMEHRRDFPLDEHDMFAFLTAACQFNEENIRKQLRELELNPVFLRQLRLVPEKKTIKSIVIGKPDREEFKIKPMDDAKGGWFVYEFPNKENAFSVHAGYFDPTNKSMYQAGVDTTQDRIAIDGSNPCILIFKKSCIIEGVETGMYPVAIWISPTRLDIHFDEEVKKAALWYGCTANYELDRRTDFYRYFCKENCQAFLEWTPKIAQNPLKKKDKEYGTRSGDPFQLAAQLQVAKMYIDGTDNDVYNGHVHRIVFPTLLNELLRYDHLDRQKSDQCIALFMALLPIFGEIQMPIINKSVRKLLPTHKIKVPA